MLEVEQRVDRLETAMSHMADTVDRTWREMREDRLRFERSMLDIERRAEKDREQAEKDRQQGEKDREASAKRFDEQNKRYEKERKESNKRWAEISDSMGTLIEDMVAPCGFQLAKAIFDDEEAETCAIRIKRKHPAKPGQMMELDLLAIGPTKVLVVEAKRRMDATKVTEYRDKVRLLSEFFPELAGKTVCPAVASVYLEASVITLLNREELHGVAMGDETMQVVNLGAF